MTTVRRLDYNSVVFNLFLSSLVSHGENLSLKEISYGNTVCQTVRRDALVKYRVGPVLLALSFSPLDRVPRVPLGSV